MKHILVLSLALLSLVSSSQTKTPNLLAEREPLFKKKTFQFGFQTSFGMVYSTPEHAGLAVYTLNPKIHYFITDRMSIGLGYLGVKADMHKATLIHSGEVELKYFLNPKSSSTLFYAQGGLLFGQYKPVLWNPNYSPSESLTMKLGVGMTWRFRQYPNLALNVEMNNYFGINGIGKPKLKIAPNISVGISFYMNRKRNTAGKLTGAKALGEF